MKLPASCVLLAAVLAAGCGSDVPDVPETAPVTGIVTRGGTPVEGASVQFFPSSGAGASEGAYPATGMTGPDGRFTLSTFFTPQAVSEGAVPGRYNVTVTKSSAPAEAASPDGHGESQAVAKNLLPAIYASPSTTTLAANIEPGKANEIALELKK